MSHPFLPVNTCCTDVVINNPCGCTSTLPNTGCGQDQCGTNVILSSNVIYNGPILDCIIAEPCDTLNVILQKIDEIICNLLTQINILNIQVTNITTQIININSNIVNINNILSVCCDGATTTTTSTTSCPCTYHEYVSIPQAQVPGTFTYVECDTFEVLTVTSSIDVNVVCVNNNYPTIEIGKINVLNTGECCSVITTTTTTTVVIQSFCNEVTVIGTVYLYWTTGGGEPQVLKIDDETVYICAQVGSIAVSGTGAVTILGSAITCESDGECAPTTTTTTTIALPCTSYNLEATSTDPKQNVWEAVECETFITVGGTIIFPNILNTGCVIDGSLLLGSGVIIVDSEPCPTTTTTTTLTPSTTTTTTTLFPPPSTTTTTTLFPPSTTTTTTTIAPCVEWSWEAIGPNSSNLEYTDCDGLPVVIPIIDVTNNSGIICVYPSVTPEWNPGPTLGTHIISTVGADCTTTTTTSSTSTSSTTTTTTTCPCKSFDVIIDENDLIASSEGIVDVGFIDCFNQPQIYSYDISGTYTNAFCAVLFPKEPLQSYLLGTTVIITVDQPTITGCCTGGCVQYTISSNPGDASWTALDCDGVEVSGSLIYSNIEVLDCLQQGTLEIINGTVESEEPCPTTTTTTTVAPTTTTTTTFVE